MKLIYEPKVYLVGAGAVVPEELERFLDAEAPERQYVPYADGAAHDAERLCEVGGRLCYMSFKNPRPGGTKTYLRNILESGHGSVLEHATFNFIFTGISRSLTHELVRHRAGWSYSQLSQRYVDESVAEYVVPHDLREEVTEAQRVLATWQVLTPGREAREALELDNHSSEVEIGLCWLASMEEMTDSYRWLTAHLTTRITREKYDEYVARQQALGQLWSLEERTAIRKAARQAARSVLPNATETKIFATANARALRHFLELRGSRHAEPEIRKLAHAVWSELNAEAPNLFGDYEAKPLPDGTHELTTTHRKV